MNSIARQSNKLRGLIVGYSVTWCGIRSRELPALLDRLHLYATGETEHIPESLISTAKLHTGWGILLYNRYGCPFLTPGSLRHISDEHDVILCMIEEHAMASSAELWSQGQRKWWISHVGENGPSALRFEGELPECFHNIREAMENAQRGDGDGEATVDHIFEIPLMIAQALVGFKHDDASQIVDKEFVVLSQH